MIRASVHGRLGADPVERTTRNDHAMVTVSVAVNAARHGAGEETMWISLVGFGKAGEVLARHQKGDLVSAMGPLYRIRFTGRDGTEREGWSMTVESILSARTTRPTGGRKRDAAQRPSSVERDGADAHDEMSDDIPF